MFFYDRFIRLLNEFLEFKRYKKMPLILRIFVSICLTPFFLLFFIFFLISLLQSWIFIIIETPIRMLHEIVTKEGEKVKHATQFIIYFISWPFIFLFYISYAFMTLTLAILYVFTSIFGYVASLGGYKFHVSAHTESIEKDFYESKYIPQSTVFFAINAFMLLAFSIFVIITYSMYSSYYSYYFFTLLIIGAIIYGSFYILFCFIYIPISFARKDKAITIVECAEGKKE